MVAIAAANCAALSLDVQAPKERAPAQRAPPQRVISSAARSNSSILPIIPRCPGASATTCRHGASGVRRRRAAPAGTTAAAIAELDTAAPRRRSPRRRRSLRTAPAGAVVGGELCGESAVNHSRGGVELPEPSASRRRTPWACRAPCPRACRQACFRQGKRVDHEELGSVVPAGQVVGLSEAGQLPLAAVVALRPWSPTSPLRARS